MNKLFKREKSCESVTQSCLTVYKTMDCSPPDSSVREILQARILEWIAIPFSRGSSWPRDRTWISHIAGRFFTIWTINSVQFGGSVMSSSWWLQHTRPLCPSPTPGAYSNSRPLSWWCHPTSSSSVVPVSFCPQSFPESGSFQMSQLFPSGGQSIGVSASTSVLPMNTQNWSPLGWTGWISLQSKGLSRVSSNTTVQKHQFFGPQPSLWSYSHIHTWLLKKP